MKVFELEEDEREELLEHLASRPDIWTEDDSRPGVWTRHTRGECEFTIAVGHERVFAEGAEAEPYTEWLLTNFTAYGFRMLLTAAIKELRHGTTVKEAVQGILERLGEVDPKPRIAKPRDPYLDKLISAGQALRMRS